MKKAEITLTLEIDATIKYSEYVSSISLLGNVTCKHSQTDLYLPLGQFSTKIYK